MEQRLASRRQVGYNQVHLPMTDVQTPEEQLRREVAGLDDDEILALCYAFKGNQQRLRLYIDVLRHRGGQRAQFASCLICFDLARQGESSFQREFVLLSSTMRDLAQNAELVTTLVGSDPYLIFIWEICQASLAEVGEADGTDFEPVRADQPVAQLELLADSDFQDFTVATDDKTLWRSFDDAVEAFLGGMVGVPMYERGCGFRLQSSRDTERIETFLRRLDSLSALVPPARGFRALTLLFYGTQLRSRGLFGQVNSRKQDLLRRGLVEFVESPQDVWEVVGVIGPMHADAAAWGLICDALVDYAAWLQRYPEDALAGIDAYDPVAFAASRR